MVRVGHGPADWRDEGPSSATASHGHRGVMVTGERGSPISPAAAQKAYRARHPRDLAVEAAARRIKRAAMRAALREAEG